MKAKTSLIAAFAAGALVLSACGSDSPGQSDPSAPLQFYLSGDANQGGGYATMAAEYEEETGQRVEIVDIAYDDLSTRITNAALADDLPALARMPSTDPVWMDQTSNLREIGEAHDVMIELSPVGEDGHVYSLPSDVTAVGMFLNTSLWDEAGVSYPTDESDIWTWDEFIDATQQVQAATGARYGMVMDRTSHRLTAFLVQHGSTMWQPDADGVYGTNDATKPALETFKELNDDTFMPRSVWLSEDDPSALFKTGQVASYISGSWQIADFASTIGDFEWASVYMPTGEERATNFGQAAEVVVFQGDQEEAALAFVDWLYTPENYKRLAEYSGMLPAVHGVQPDYTDNADEFALYNEEIAATPPIIGELKQDSLRNSAEGRVTDGDPVREEVIRYLADEITVDEAIENISQRFNEDLGVS